MTAEIICVGTELLLGNIVNTNAAFLSEKLAYLGINCYFQTVVGDNRDRLLSVINTALSRADILIFSGGLGPTEDDLTKETVAEALGKSLSGINGRNRKLRNILPSGDAFPRTTTGSRRMS